MDIHSFGNEKQAMVLWTIFLFYFRYFEWTLHIHDHDFLHWKIKEQIFNYQRKLTTEIIRIPLPPSVPIPQNKKRGVDASFSFSFGLCFLIRRLSLTLKKKSFRVFSLPITSKSSRDPWWLVEVMCSCTAVGFVLLVDGWRVIGVIFKCSHQRTFWCRSVLPIYELLQARHV